MESWNLYCSEASRSFEASAKIESAQEGIPQAPEHMRGQLWKTKTKQYSTLGQHEHSPNSKTILVVA